MADGHNSMVHIFDAPVLPAKQGMAVRDQPGWITFSIDGLRAYPWSGEVIDTRTRKPVRAGDQFGKRQKR